MAATLRAPRTRQLLVRACLQRASARLPRRQGSHLGGRVHLRATQSDVNRAGCPSQALRMPQAVFTSRQISSTLRAESNHLHWGVPLACNGLTGNAGGVAEHADHVSPAARSLSNG